MQTNIHPELRQLPEVAEAETILRSCVHCGFCTAVCPTYQELGDDLDSPRGRIYLIKNMLEEDSVGNETHHHLDRCLTCRSCETTCPSGVQYGRLLDISKGLLQTRFKPPRTLLNQSLSWGLRQLLPRPGLFGFLYRLGRFFKPILPSSIKAKMPEVHFMGAANVVVTNNEQNALLLQGCVQRSLTPGVNQAIAALLARQGVAVNYLQEEGCCGAVDYHLGHHDDGLDRMRELTDRIHEQLAEVDFVISSASGCGVTLKDYPELFANDQPYRQKAEDIKAKLRDVSEVIVGAAHPCKGVNIAVHVPCTLQHGQKLPHRVQSILAEAGATVLPVADSHLCCGSAGTYSVLQPELASRLGERKVAALEQHAPEVIVTANVGCQTHLSELAGTPVMHWAEFLAINSSP